MASNLVATVVMASNLGVPVLSQVYPCSGPNPASPTHPPTVRTSPAPLWRVVAVLSVSNGITIQTPGHDTFGWRPLMSRRPPYTQRNPKRPDAKLWDWSRPANRAASPTNRGSRSRQVDQQRSPAALWREIHPSGHQQDLPPGRTGPWAKWKCPWTFPIFFSVPGPCNRSFLGDNSAFYVGAMESMCWSTVEPRTAPKSCWSDL